MRFWLRRFGGAILSIQYLKYNQVDCINISNSSSISTPPPNNQNNQIHQTIKEYKNSNERHRHREEMINNYTDELLSTNIELKNDFFLNFFVGKLYRFTIKLTLDAILASINNLDGIELLGHRIRLQFNPNDIKSLPRPEKVLDIEPIRHFVSKLLEDDQINFQWLPDWLEQKVYFNCLLLILTVIQSFLGTTKIELLGHSIVVNMSPERIDFDKLVKKVKYERENVSEAIIDKLIVDLLESEKNNIYIPDSFERGMYKTLYALILCLLEEILQNMKINVIGDEISFRLEPGSINPKSIFYCVEGGTQQQQSTNSTSFSSQNEAIAANVSEEIRRRYRQLVLDEIRSQNILNNIQNQKQELEEEMTRINENLVEKLRVQKMESSYDASTVGYSLFVISTIVGVCFLLFKKD